jgi:hypothetical protein
MDKSTRIAEAVRRACLEAAQDAYEQAGISGLCAEGRWEVALDAIRQLDVVQLVDAEQNHSEQ